MSTMDSEKKRRFDKYMAFIEGQNSISIAYLHGATGIDRETIGRDIREMLSRHYFSNEAYYDYRTNTLILKNEVKGQKCEKAALNTAVMKPKLHGVLLAAGIVLTVVGGAFLLNGMDTLTANTLTAAPIWELIKGGIFSAAGILLLCNEKNKQDAYRLCCRLIATLPASRESVSIEELSKSSGITKYKIRNLLEKMITAGVLDSKAVFNRLEDRLYPKGIPEKPITPPAKKAEENSEKSEYDRILAEIRQLNIDILDEPVSAKMDQMEEVTGKIFRLVQEKPEKKPLIQSFMNYYLPTTLKLLRSYRTLERQGIEGENIAAAKDRIEKILDKLVLGYTQQLDQLFRDDALDISTDIDVLETMMKRDGLTEEKSVFAGEVR